MQGAAVLPAPFRWLVHLLQYDITPEMQFRVLSKHDVCVDHHHEADPGDDMGMDALRGLVADASRKAVNVDDASEASEAADGGGAFEQDVEGEQLFGSPIPDGTEPPGHDEI